MSAEKPEVNPYELLGLGVESTEQEIKSAYRKLSLKVHPDRNPNNPQAAQKFHELNQAYELLLDPLRRLALNSAVQAQAARKARFAKFDAKRKHFLDELDAGERAVKKSRAGRDGDGDARAREQEAERIKEAGRKMREEREREMARRQAEDDAAPTAGADPGHDVDVAPQLGKHDTTIKLKFALGTHPELASRPALLALLSTLGAVDEGSVVLSVRPPKKAPQRPPKHGTAIAEFRQIRDAFGAVCASGRRDRGLQDVEVTWAAGAEPPILGWLRRQGMLGASNEKTKTENASSTATQATPSSADLLASLTAKIAKSKQPSTFSSFPDSFPSTQETSTPAKQNASGLDYESLTFMRLMNANKEKLEREKLEREILEQEANE